MLAPSVGQALLSMWFWCGDFILQMNCKYKKRVQILRLGQKKFCDFSRLQVVVACVGIFARNTHIDLGTEPGLTRFMGHKILWCLLCHDLRTLTATD